MTASSIQLNLHCEYEIAACHGPLPLHTVIYLITQCTDIKGEPHNTSFCWRQIRNREMPAFRKVWVALFHHHTFFFNVQSGNSLGVKWTGFLLITAKAWSVVCCRLLPYVVLLCAEYKGRLLKRSAHPLAVSSTIVSYASCIRCVLASCEPSMLNLLKMITTFFFRVLLLNAELRLLVFGGWHFSQVPSVVTAFQED